MNTIIVKNLVKNYGKIKALKGVSFSIKEGEFFGLLGPNGAGKTTVINILAGLLEKDSGEVSILGKNPLIESEFIKNKMNVASAYFGLSDILTVKQNLRVYAKLYHVKNVEERINLLLKQLELTKLANTQTIRLSSGELTRVSICKGLINEPEILLLDECTVGLDPHIAEKTRKFIQDYQKDKKATILFTSHYMYEVEELCKRIAFLSEGKLLNIDTANNLKKMIKKQTVEFDFIKTNKGLTKFFKEKNIDVIFTKGNTVVFEVSASDDKLYRTMNSLFKRGFKVKDMRINRPTLNDIFIKIARGKI